MDSYNSFARFYDGLMEDARYPERCEYILALCKRFHHETGKTLDLACGTGSLTRELAKRGVDVYGADGSVDMLSEAVQKSLAENLRILYINQQMQRLDLLEKTDTCVCTLDSINHLTEVDDVRKTFESVSRFMNVGGLFIFDANTVYKHREVLANNAYILENETVFCAWQNTLLENDIVEIDLDFFEEDNGAYYRYSECFSERAYSDGQLKEMLAAAGFETVAVYGDLSFEAPKADEQRATYVAQKI